MPFELVIDILSRLPVKSLGRFKCVSKTWLSLISSHEFIKTHLAVASGRDDYEHHRLMFTAFGHRGRWLQICSLNPLLYPASSSPKEFNVDSEVKSYHYITGSCNGLVCIEIDRAYIDPRKAKQLPDAGGFPSFGFGYDKLNDDYKEVGAFQIDNNITIKVHSLKNDLWHWVEGGKIEGRIIRWPKYPLQYAGGKFHWFVMDGKCNGFNVVTHKIASFDLADETYVEMDYPQMLGQMTMWGLVTLDLEPWETAFPYGLCILKTYCKLVGSLRNCDILFVCHGRLFLYDQKTNTSRGYPQIGDFGQATLYVESLVSP
ncbi:OLC1v1035297C1 [Oldenlandia corymbosa var. corymbosa]|uniref:OLC1v1035297C1 n=1 Tax=Oldenlandia corymbosa var. corymbosa TaxID=529605 RepID=A0AAV1CTV9_OLDCO|nr:OLC1v1035297C1 [Oldenlandia corymbosa var. corymbosa]